MSRWRIAVVAVLLVLPLLILAGLGLYFLWSHGWMFYVWWPLAGSMGLGYLLAYHWQRKRFFLPPPDFNTLPRWTERDGGAWKLVQARAEKAAVLSSDQLSDLQSFVSTAQEMARELAEFYHPGSQDPIDNLTIPEILAVVELASHDLSVMVDRYLPAGHLLTVKNWQQARQLTGLYSKASNLYWAAAALFSPLDTGIRFAAARFGLTQPWQLLQQNLLLWFFTAFIHRLGTYLIEVNSGRLRVGATRFRQLSEAQNNDALVREDAAIDEVRQIKITLLGQVKAGKSSLVNALLGQQRAQTDVLPCTDGVEKYELQTVGIPHRLILLDTVGYGHEGPKADQVAATRSAARDSDLLLLVLHARNPGRQADLAMLQGLWDWFASQPDLKRPPCLAVVSHVDLLSPSFEWAPPYDWQKGGRPKEMNIRDAVAYAGEQLGESVAGVVPLCTAPGKVFGVEEWLLPALVARLDEVRGVAFLRCLRGEIKKGRIRKVFRQLAATGLAAAQIAYDRLRQK
jgi:predicted GTPase